MVERHLPDPAIQPEPDKSLRKLVQRKQHRHRREKQRAGLADMPESRHADRSDHAGGDKAGSGRKAHAVYSAEEV
nr:hypothetical protein [Sphingobium sp. TKS]